MTIMFGFSPKNIFIVVGEILLIKNRLQNTPINIFLCELSHAIYLAVYHFFAQKYVIIRMTARF